MKNIILLIGFIIVMGLSIASEPITDTFDVIAGATNVILYWYFRIIC